MSWNSTINEINNPPKPSISIPNKIPMTKVSNSMIILKKCGSKKYINPFTGNCVQ